MGEDFENSLMQLLRSQKGNDMHKVSTAAIVGLLLLGGTSVGSADTIIVGDGATGTGPYNLISNSSTPDSYIEVDLSTPFGLSTVSSLSAIFSDSAGGADGGSPRIVLGATNGDFFLTYLGTPPGFSDSDPATLTSLFSGMNLDNGTNNSAFENSGSYQTFASLQTLYGSDQISSVSFAVDGGWAANGPQALALNSLNVNGSNVLASTPVPEPSSLAMLLAGLGVVAGALYFGRKKAMAA